MTIDPERLDELLAREPYLEDGGFTDRVMASLPSRRRDPRPWILGASVAAALAVGYAVLPGAVAAALQAVASMPLPAGVTPGLLMAALSATAAAALVALVLAVES
jgi:hypothetical protein